MKNNLFKKSMSVFLSILMLMSAWVWVAPTEAEALATVDTYRTADKYGTPYWNGSDVYYSRWNSGGSYTTIQWPKHIYLDISETLQSAGYYYSIEWYYGSGTDYRIINNGFIFGGYGIGSGWPDNYYTMTNMFSNYSLDGSLSNGGFQQTSNNTDGDLFIGVSGLDWDGAKTVIFRSRKTTNNEKVFMLGTPKSVGTGRYSTSGNKPSSFGGWQQWKSSKWQSASDKYTKDNGSSNWTTDCYEGTWKEVAFDITVYDKSALSSVVAIAEDCLSKAGSYTKASIDNLRNVYNNKAFVLTTRATTQANIDDATNLIQTAINGLKPIVKFDNLINFGEWNTTSASNATISNVTSGGFTLTSNSGAGEGTSSSPYFPVSAGKKYTIDIDITGDAWDVYIFFCDENGNWIDFVDGQTNRYSTTTTWGSTFTAPNKTNVVKAQIRVDANGSNNSVTFKDIRVYEEGMVSEDVSYVPAKTYTYNTALGNTLPVPTRTGYTFNGWWVDTVNPNGKKDAGEEVSDGNGNVIDSLKTFAIIQGWLLYSDWTVNKYSIKFVDAAGNTVSTQTVEYGKTPSKPANTAADYDSANHYSYSWPTINAATGDATYKEIKTPTAHSMSSKVTTDATCTEDGVRTYTCSGCAYSYTEAIGKTGHTEVTVAGKDATCTESGLTDGKKCSTCGATTVAQQTIDPLGHLDTNKDHVCDRGCGIAQGTCSDSATDNDHLCDYGCGKTLEACSDKTGDNDHKCDVCGADNITDHIKGEETKENITEATCGSAGKYDSVYYCTECNTEMERTNDVTIEQKPHNWQDATYSWTADGKSCTVTRACANDADHTESETVNATGVQNVAPTCEAKGSTLYTAKFTATWAEEQTKEVYDIPENGHTPAEAVIEKNVPATCTEDGSYDTVVYCSVEGCEKELSRVTTTVPATGHTSGAAVVENNVDATCTTDGSYDNVTYCTVCGAETGRTTIVVPQKGHTPGEAATCTTAQICTVCDAVLVAALKHEYNSVVTDPTCTEGGYTTYTCTRCSDTYTDDKVEALGHEWNDATCIAPKTCSVCGETEGEALGHTWTAATCTASKTCSVCGETEGEALGHKWNDATCTAPKTCSVCGETEGEALGHKWNDATCTTPKTCSVCGATEGDVLGHDYKAVVTDPTCTDKGFTTHTCSRCSDSYVDTYVDALEHAWSDTYTMESDGKDGKHYQTCTRENCEAKNEAVAHTWNDGVENPEADCENAGTMTYTCTAKGCGATYTETVDADGHSLGEWIEEIPATCVAEGTKGHYECTVCHKYFEEDKTTVIADLTIDINPDNHDLKTTEAKAPTCTEDGWDEYVTCKREGCDYTTYSEKGKLGHAYGDWEFVDDGQHKRVCANDENHVETEACADSTTDEDCLCDKCGELVAHSYGNATCDAPAKCTVCGDETGDKLGHDYTVFVETVDYTCEADGYTVYKCSRCDATENRDITNAAHRPEADYTVMQKATCEEDGYKAILCSMCKDELETETITKRAHVYKDNGEAKAATCLEAGEMNIICTNIETDTHKACVHKSTKVIPMLDHSYTGDYQWNNYADKAKTHSQKCVNGCNEYGNETECTFEDVVTPATCYVNGYTTYTCSVCNSNYQSDYTTRTHDYAYAEGNGTSHDVTCKYTDCNYTATENCSGGTATCTDLAICEKCKTAWGEKDTTNHTGEANVTKNYKDATCSAEGYTGDIHWSCCYALETKGTVVGKLAHTEATREENRNEASCGADGSYDLVTYCSVCKEVIKTEKKTIPATGKHNYATEKERVEPTCQNEGYYVMACGCGTTKTYELETVDHKYLTYTNNGDATCQNNATETAKCSFKCGATDTREIENSKVGHKYETYVRNNDATCQKNETETASCSFGCNETHTREIAGSKVGHKYVTYTKNNDATCQKNETETASCSFNCGKTDTREIANSKAEHKYTTYTSDNNAKCEEDGTKTALCDYGCETTHTVTDEGSALNHDYDTTKSEANLTRPALVEGVWTKGYYTYTCKNDADHKDYEYVERASYTAYDVAVETLTTLLEGSTLTDDAKADIENALNANKIDDNYIATSAEQKIIDDATARLNVIIEGIENGTLLKAYFDAALEDLATAKKLADEKDVIAATITKIASIEKAIADLQEKDVDATAQPVIDALEDQLEEIIVGIKSGTLLRPDYKDWNEAVGVYNGLDKSNVQDSIVAEAKDLILEIAMKQGDPNLTLTTATQNRIDEATARLNAIVAGIKDNTLIKPNYADAQAAIANAEALGNKLSKDEKTALVEQKDALTEIMSNPDSNKAEHQNDVDAIKAEVQKIIDKYAECVSGNHNWSAPVLTTAPTAEAQGEYTETCGTCAEVQITKVALADYDDFNAVVAQLNVLAETENLKAEAVETIADALAKAEALDKNLLADVTVSGNVIKGGQDEIDALVAELNEVADTMNAAITDGSLVKVDYTAADEAIKAAEKDLDGGKLTDSDKATLDNLKRQLDEIKNNPASNKKDNQAAVDAIKNTAEAIADKYAGCANGNHSYKVTTVAPTCENEGYKLHTCTVCGKSYKDSTVGALGHIEVILPAVDATCGHNGYTEGVKCSSCGEILTAQQIIPSLPHTDADDDGICDECNGNGIYDGCQCACHKDSGLFKIIYAILRILWKIFKINPSCACGRVHY